MFRTFRYINEIHKEKSFSKAAQKLYISQSSLSLTIKKFEKEAGIRIFDRSTVPIQLTEAGSVYLNGIQKILAIQSDLEAYVDDYRELKAGTLTVGAPYTFSSFLLPTLIARFLEYFPGVEIRLKEADFHSLYNMTQNGEVDIIIESNSFDDSLFHSKAVFREHVLLAVPKNDSVNDVLREKSLTMEDISLDRHLQADWPSISLSNFREHRFLVLQKGHDMPARTTQMCRDSGFELQIFMVLNQLMTCYNLADQQLGVSFVSDTAVKLSNKGRGLLFYKVGGDLASRYINLAYKRNRYVSRAMRAFINMVSDIGSGGKNTVSSL